MEHEDVSASQCLLPTELNFYQAYAWCLNPYPQSGKRLITFAARSADSRSCQLAGSGAKLQQTYFCFPVHL
jgi:hypothetical protein